MITFIVPIDFIHDIMTYHFHKQSPWETQCCSFESHDLRFFLHSGYIVFSSSSPALAHTPYAHIDKQMEISQELKFHFWLTFKILFSFVFKPPKLLKQTIQSLVSILVDIVIIILTM